MKNRKKLIGIIISVVLVVSLLATVLVVTANTKEASISISVDKAELSAGESATVSVSVESNFPVATMSIPVFYDKTMVDVSEPIATLDDYAVSSAIIDTTSVDTSKIYANTDISEEKFGFVLVNYIGEAGAEVPESINSVVLTFTITAKDNVNGTAAVKCISESQKTDSNVAGMLYFGATITGRTIDAIPENIEKIDLTSAEKSVKITNGGTALEIIDGTTAVIDRENKYVYGITVGDSVENYFKVNNGTLEIVPSPAGAKNGTGAILNVKNSSGEIVESYTIIIFGDVNGDGEIKVADVLHMNLCLSSGTATGFSEIQALAADIDGNKEIQVADMLFINLCLAAGTNDSLTINPYA